MMSLDSSRQRSHTLRGIQALRGIAALMVVVHHSTFVWVEHFLGYVWWNGAAGVDIFFIISGLVMSLTADGKESGVGAAGKFLERRVIRIVPLYWILSLATLCKVYILAHHSSLQNHAHHAGLTTSFVVRSFLLIPPTGGQHPLLGQGWTLSYEMFFYLLFALCLALGRRVDTTLPFILIPLGLGGFFQSSSWSALLTLVSPLLLEFLAGLWVGSAMRKGVNFDRVWLMVFGVLCLPILWTTPSLGGEELRVFRSGIPAFFIVLGAVAAEARFSSWWPKWLLLIGDSSYSLYLTHSLTLLVMEALLIRTRLFTTSLPAWLIETMFLLICSLVCIVVGVGTYYGLEKKLIVAFRHLLPDRKHKIIAEAYKTAK
jgi:exopolysaccharide production protein ExoZ